MKIVEKIVFFFFFIFIFLFSQEKSIIEYDAQKIVFNNFEKSIKLVRSASIKGDSFQIKADSFLIFPDSSRLFAFGKAEMIFDEFDFKADSLSYDYEKKNGYVFNGKTNVEKISLKGKKIFIRDENFFSVQNGMFTTCKNEEPHYWFYSLKTLIYRNDRVVIYPVILFIREVPVFGLPIFMFPIANTRKSGFLMPKFGYTSFDGFYLKQLSYFWATNDYSDMTFSLDLIQKRGYLLGYELRVLYDPILFFNMNGNYIFENNSKRRWSIKGDYSHKIFYDIILKSKIDFVSDISTTTDYSDTLVLDLKREATSFVSLQKNFKLYNLYLNFERKENFSNRTVSMVLPLYSGYFKKVSFLNNIFFIPNGINYQHSHSTVNSLFRDSILEKKNLNLRVVNSFDSFYKFFYYLNIFPSYAINFYSDSFFNKNVIDEKYGVKFNTQLYGISIFSLGFFEKLRHTFIPEIDFEKSKKIFYTYFSSRDSIKSEEKITINFTNIFEGKSELEKLVLLRNNVNFNYDLNKDSLSFISFSNHLFPEKKINASFNFLLDPYTKKLNENYILTLSSETPNPFNEHRKMLLNLGYVLERNDSIKTNSVNSSLNFFIGENLDVNFSTLYDVKSKRFVWFSTSLKRSLHCWEANFKVSSYSGIIKYDFQILIKDIPEISIDKGFFGPLLP